MSNKTDREMLISLRKTIVQMAIATGTLGALPGIPELVKASGSNKVTPEMITACLQIDKGWKTAQDNLLQLLANGMANRLVALKLKEQAATPQAKAGNALLAGLGDDVLKQALAQPIDLNDTPEEN